MDASEGFVSTYFSLPTCAARHVSTLGAWAAAAPLQAWYSLVTLTPLPLDAPCGILSRSSAVSAGRTQRWERRCHICAGPRPGVCTVTGLTPATSAPGLSSPRPHLHGDWDVSGPATAGRGLAPPLATSAPGLGSPVPHLHRDWVHPGPHLPAPYAVLWCGSHGGAAKRSAHPALTNSERHEEAQCGRAASSERAPAPRGRWSSSSRRLRSTPPSRG